MDFEKYGQKIDKIEVKISYRIIELFSAGLYSSPNKAFEELVSNSYDANATKVSIHVPSHVDKENSIFWVCDNGESMDQEELKDLWNIGYSPRESIRNTRTSKDRLIIGKFGIGKLATYVLARKLSYICKKNDKFLLVSMDYGLISPDSSGLITLDEKEITISEVKEIIEPLILNNGVKLLDFNLWGKNAEKTWTFAILSDLRPRATKIQEGRLRWILSTALPLNPNFNLFFNGSRIASSKEKIKPRHVWKIGEEEKDDFLDKYGYTKTKYNGIPALSLPNLNNVTGSFELFRESLVGKKSDKWSRSHGIFVKVRDRLVNLDDPLFGGPQLTFTVFNKLRILINADELDTYLTSTRESVKDTEAVKDLLKYIERKVSRIKTFYLKEITKEDKINQASYKISRTATNLSRRPLLIVAKKYFEGVIDSPFLIKLPKRGEDDVKHLEKLNQDFTDEEGFIKKIELIDLGIDAPIVRFDLVNRTAKINLLHPFTANIAEEDKSFLNIFKLLAATEILTEAYMIESGIPQITINSIMVKRDELLRELASSDSLNTIQVAQNLQATLADPSGLEDALCQVFRSLGFEVIPRGGPNNPDGIATAIVRDEDGKRNDFIVTLEAKSTLQKKVKKKDTNIATVAICHKTDNNANYSIIVGRDFVGGEDEKLQLPRIAKKLKVTLIKAKDLWELLLISFPKQLTSLDFKDMLSRCYSPIQVRKWIDEIYQREVSKKPIEELLKIVYQLSKDDDEQPSIYAIRRESEILKKYSVPALRTLIKTLENFLGKLISINKEDIVSIQSNPERIMKILNEEIKPKIPSEVKLAYYKLLGVDNNLISSEKQEEGRE